MLECYTEVLLPEINQRRKWNTGSFRWDPWAQGRLTTDGLGASKPIDTDDTSKGRSQNRRVEFVKE